MTRLPMWRHCNIAIRDRADGAIIFFFVIPFSPFFFRFWAKVLNCWFYYKWKRLKIQYGLCTTVDSFVSSVGDIQSRQLSRHARRWRYDLQWVVSVVVETYFNTRCSTRVCLCCWSCGLMYMEEYKWWYNFSFQDFQSKAACLSARWWPLLRTHPSLYSHRLSMLDFWLVPMYTLKSTASNLSKKTRLVRIMPHALGYLFCTAPPVAFLVRCRCEVPLMLLTVLLVEIQRQ